MITSCYLSDLETAKRTESKLFWENIKNINDEIGQRVGKNDVADWSKRELKPMNTGRIIPPEQRIVEDGIMVEIIHRDNTGDIIIYGDEERNIKIETHLKDKKQQAIFHPVAEYYKHQIAIIAKEIGFEIICYRENDMDSIYPHPHYSYSDVLLVTIDLKTLKVIYADLFLRWQDDCDKKKKALCTPEDHRIQEVRKLRKIYSDTIFNRMSDRDLFEYVKLEKQLKEKEVKPEENKKTLVVTLPEYFKDLSPAEQDDMAEMVNEMIQNYKVSQSIDGILIPHGMKVEVLEEKASLNEPAKECQSCSGFDYELRNGKYHCSYCGRRAL